MTRKIAVINDLSGLGRCSLTAAISVLSSMGVQPCPLPTAILSSQTEYPSYYSYDFTGKMDHFRQEWKKLGTEFSGIYTGYTASVAQIEQIFRFLDTFQKNNTFLVVDPVMGDDGLTYDMYTGELLAAMKQLVTRADVITPNDGYGLCQFSKSASLYPGYHRKTTDSQSEAARGTSCKNHHYRHSFYRQGAGNSGP